VGDHLAPEATTMTAQPLPALTSGDPSAWDQALYAFLVEKGNRSGSKRTVESYSQMLWPFFADLRKTPDRVKPADVLAFVHGIGKSGRTPSTTTVGARIACLSSFYRFLIRMGLVVSTPATRSSGHRPLSRWPAATRQTRFDVYWRWFRIPSPAGATGRSC
jgi:site-specific recombinase XerD